MCKLCNNSEPVHKSDRENVPHLNIAKEYISDGLCKTAKALLSKERCKGNDIDSYIINKLIKVYGGKVYGYANVGSVRAGLFTRDKEASKERAKKHYSKNISLRRVEKHIREHTDDGSGVKSYIARISINHTEYSGTFECIQDAREYIRKIKKVKIRENVSANEEDIIIYIEGKVIVCPSFFLGI